MTLRIRHISGSQAVIKAACSGGSFIQPWGFATEWEKTLFSLPVKTHITDILSTLFRF